MKFIKESESSFSFDNNLDNTEIIRKLNYAFEDNEPINNQLKGFAPLHNQEKQILKQAIVAINPVSNRQYLTNRYVTVYFIFFCF